MVIAINKVTETVATVHRPSYQESSVYTQLEISDHRRHKEQINFRPVLHPVRYADTHFLKLNNTWKRFVSRTFYEPRVRPRSFSETTYTNPKTADQLFVSYLDFHVDENRKWYKTCVEIKAKKFTSAQILRSPNNNYINTGTTTTTTTITGQNSLGVPSGLPLENSTANHLDEVSLAAGHGQSVQEKYDPGASQVYIPKRRERPFDHHALVNGELILNFPNSKVELNGDTDEEYSDSEV